MIEKDSFYHCEPSNDPICAMLISARDVVGKYPKRLCFINLYWVHSMSDFTLHAMYFVSLRRARASHLNDVANTYQSWSATKFILQSWPQTTHWLPTYFRYISVDFVSDPSHDAYHWFNCPYLCHQYAAPLDLDLLVVVGTWTFA